jgi:hypothetical protein
LYGESPNSIAMLSSHRIFSRTFKDWIFIPSSGSTPMRWTDSSNCVWNAPEWFTFKDCLSRFEEYRPLLPLFTDTLSIKDASWNDFALYLNRIKNRAENQSSYSEIEKVAMIYKELDKIALIDREAAGCIRYVYSYSMDWKCAVLTSAVTCSARMSLSTTLKLDRGWGLGIALGLKSRFSFQGNSPWLQRMAATDTSSSMSSKSLLRISGCTSNHFERKWKTDPAKRVL